jgi:hypothetical protein
MNILIHEFEPNGMITDKEALEQFQRQWATYQKLIDSNALSHREAGEILRGVLAQEFSESARFLDIACGDARQISGVLIDAPIRHYHGIDLSKPALELAAENLKQMPFGVELDHRDFVEAIMKRDQPTDVAWCSLSIHHLQRDEKLELFQAIRESTTSMLMIYEPTSLDGEERDQYMERFCRIFKKEWSMLNSDEWAQMEQHVTKCDFPESASGWLELGKEAGFVSSKQLFSDPTNFFSLYRYDCK